MSDEAQNAAVPVDGPDGLIRVLRDDDVLLGRGLGPSKFIGNKRFRDLADSRRKEYVNNDSYNEKSRIGREVYNEIMRRNGRFLKLVSSNAPGKPPRNVVNQGTWRVADIKVALEKCKQSLREKETPAVDSDEIKRATGSPKRRKRSNESKKKRAPRKSQVESVMGMVPLSTDSLGVSDSRVAAAASSWAGRDSSTILADPSSVVNSNSMVIDSLQGVPGASDVPVLPASLFGSLESSSIDPRILLFQQALLSLQQQSLASDQTAANPSYPRDFNQGFQVPNDVSAISEALIASFGLNSMCPSVQSGSDTLQLPSSSTSMIINQAAAEQRLQHPSLPVLRSYGVQDTFTPLTTSAPSNSGGSSVMDSDEQDAIFAMAALAISGRPRFTEADEELERATITNEEKVEALCDLFGKCSVAGAHQNKRARIDLDRESIEFLIGQMKLEIDNLLPEDNKSALMEARVKCQAEEFSDARLEQFLRCEGMNTKAAAFRFAYYWECRRELFGPTKYLLPMTLSEALREDIPALEAGVYRILPHRDLSGRQLVLLEPRRNTGEGYSADSLLRAMWYVMECTAQECTDIRSGFVYIGNSKDASVWDFGAKVFARLSHFETKCWPIRFVAAHMCGSSSTLSRIISPVMKALMDRRGRTRMLIHAAQGDELFDVLSEFGIEKHMLPVEMGGLVQVDQAKWIAQRRTVEMEEIQ